MKKRILIVEDEKSLSLSLRSHFEENGLEVILAHSGAEAMIAMHHLPDLILLDWRLPDGEGIDLLKRWRKDGIETPIILLTARSEVFDKVLALELGANDYVTKPFEPREPLARVRVQTRDNDAKTQSDKDAVTSSSGIRLDSVAYRVSYQGLPVDLAKMEFELLRLFLDRPNQVLSRRELMNKVWGTGNYQTTRTIDNHVLALRQKLQASLFETVRGVGYRFSPKT